MPNRQFALCALLALTGCNNSLSAKPADDQSSNITEFNTETPDSAQTPTANYSEHKGDRYLYVGAVSDEQKRRGQAVAKVVEYRFLGEKNGLVTLEQVTEDGNAIGRIQCQRDCHIMIFTSGDAVRRIPYDSASIVGSAMADAINGLLEPVKAPPTR